MLPPVACGGILCSLAAQGQGSFCPQGSFLMQTFKGKGQSMPGCVGVREEWGVVCISDEVVREGPGKGNVSEA